MERLCNTVSKNRFVIILLVLAIICLAICVVPTHAEAANSSFVVFIAPGHTPDNGGAEAIVNGKKILESTLNEAVSIKLGEKLQAAGYTVYLTNPIKQSTSLKTIIPASEAPTDKGQYSYQNQILPAIEYPENYGVNVHPDLVISMHHNSTTSSSARGIEIYYQTNYAENTDYPKMNYGKNAAISQASKKAADLINSQLKNDLSYISVRNSSINIDGTGVKNSICRNSSVPSVLVEAGYMSNSTELQNICNSANQNALADSLKRAIDQYAVSVDTSAPTLSYLSGPESGVAVDGFAVRAYGVTDAQSGVAGVHFRVWPANQPNTNKKVFTANNFGENNWAAYVDVSSFGTVGPYYIDAYATNNSGTTRKIGRTIIDRINTAGTITSSGMTFGATNPTKASGMAVYVKNVLSNSAVTNVDIVAYRAESKETSIGVYPATKSGNDWYIYYGFGDYGTYYFDAYATNAAGQRVQLVSKQKMIRKNILDVNPPTMESLNLGTTDVTAANAFAAQAIGVKDDYGVKSVDFHIYTASGGANSAKVFSGAEYQSGNWAAYIDLTQVGLENDAYYIDVYGTDIYGNTQRMGRQVINRVNQDASITTESIAYGTQMPAQASAFAMQAKGVSAQNGVSKVEFVIYNTADKAHSSVIYNAFNAGDGIWALYFSNANHNNMLGTYNIDVFVTDQSGNRTKTLETQSMQLVKDQTGPNIANVVVGASNPTQNRTFALQAQGVSDPNGVKLVQFEVWRSDQDYNTRQIFKAADYGEGLWAACASVKETGIYTIDAVAQDTLGNISRKRTELTVIGDSSAPIIEKLAVGASNPSYNKEFALQAQGVSDVGSGVKLVQFEVWRSDKDYSTRQIFMASDYGNGLWAAFASVSEPGNYTIDVVAQDNIGNISQRKRTTLEVKDDKEAPVIEKIVAGATNPTNYFGFAMQAQGVSDIGKGIETVQFEMWRSDKDYMTRTITKASDAGNGLWAAYVSVAEPGDYTIDVIAQDKAGNLSARKRMTIKILPDTIAPKLQKLAIGTSNPTYDKGFALQAQGVSDVGSGVKLVQFEYWRVSEEYAQHKTLKASNNGGGLWSTYCSVEDQGEYYIDAVMQDNTGNISRSRMMLTVLQDANHRIMGTQDASKGQMINQLRSRLTLSNEEFVSRYQMTVEQFVDLYISEANAEGVKPDVAFAQMCLETGYLKYGADVQWNQYNFCGLGATGNGNPGHSFVTPQIGIRAQIQHLKAYASTAPLNQACVDPRFTYVNRGSAPHVEELGTAGWASSADYGTKIISIMNSMLMQNLSAQSYDLELMPEEEIVDATQGTENNGIQESVAPEEPIKKEETQIDSSTLIMGEEKQTDIEQAVAVVSEQDFSVMEIYGISTEEFVQIYWSEATQEAVNPLVAISQSVLEINQATFAQGGKDEDYNPGGLINKDGKRIQFASLQDGIRAHIQHLKCLASDQALVQPGCDPLWDDANRGTAKSILAWSEANKKPESYIDQWQGLITQIRNAAVLSSEAAMPEETPGKTQEQIPEVVVIPTETATQDTE